MTPKQSTTDNEEHSEPYFDDTKGLSTDLEEKQQRLQAERNALKQLDATVSKIDCDYGTASLTTHFPKTTRGERPIIIGVTITTPGFPDIVKTLVDAYSWSRTLESKYDRENGHLTWTLKTTLEELNKDCQRQQEGM